MEKSFRLASLLFSAIVIFSSSSVLAGTGERNIDAIVSSAWLVENADRSDVVILDVRPEESYLAGHIPGAVSAPFVVPFSAWITMRDDMLLEVPDEASLFEAIGGLGIDILSKVVVIADPNPGEPPHYGLAAATRVADTLIYAGVTDVAILDGGHSGWVAARLKVTDEVPTVTPVVFNGDVNNRMFISASYVARHLFTADLIDARDADIYFGVTTEPYANKAGHIWGASSLPAPWIWETDENNVYRFKDADLLGQMAGKVTHRSRREVIVYCGVGGYASAWWYVLTQVLGYSDVKFYDGSAQEWVLEHGMVPFKWQ